MCFSRFSSCYLSIYLFKSMILGWGYWSLWCSLWLSCCRLVADILISWEGKVLYFLLDVLYYFYGLFFFMYFNFIFVFFFFTTVLSSFVYWTVNWFMGKSSCLFVYFFFLWCWRLLWMSLYFERYLTLLIFNILFYDVLFLII